MCPFCFATVAAIAAGLVSTGGVTAAIALKRSAARQVMANGGKAQSGAQLASEEESD